MNKIIVLLMTVFLVSCATPGGQADSSTLYAYKMDENLLDRSIKRVFIAPVSFDRPTLHHLKKSQGKVSLMVKNYLKKNGFTILPDYVFNNAWNQAQREYGKAFDSSTGRVDRATYNKTLAKAIETLSKTDQFDAIVFADVVEHNAQHSGQNKHYARWFGVNRTPKTVGPGYAISANFDWALPVKVASLRVNIVDTSPKLVFSSFGGIDVTQGIDPRKSKASYVRLKRILNSDGLIEEGIAIAFHPFIKSEAYPK